MWRKQEIATVQESLCLRGQTEVANMDTEFSSNQMQNIWK